jgi:hypothetical protein
MNPEFLKALTDRELAARNLMSAANTLSDALAAFNAASDRVLAAIPVIASKVGERASAKHAGQWTDPPGTAVEEAQRKHAAIGAGRGAAGNVEQALCHAFSNGLARDSVAQTIGYEFSTEAGPILRVAGEVAAQRAPLTPPDRRFVSIITAQHQRLRAITREF